MLTLYVADIQTTQTTIHSMDPTFTSGTQTKKQELKKQSMSADRVRNELVVTKS